MLQFISSKQNTHFANSSDSTFSFLFVFIFHTWRLQLGEQFIITHLTDRTFSCCDYLQTIYFSNKMYSKVKILCYHVLAYS